MSNKSISPEIKKTSLQFSKNICQEYFKDKNKISGDEIFKLTEIKQLNLFVIRELFGKWKSEVSKLESPYFNFSSVDVQKALEEFMNVLSRNISVSKEDFEGLLTKATEETLGLLGDPRLYFSEVFRYQDNFKLEPKWINDNGKFFKSYAWVLRDLLEKMSGDFLYSNDAIIYMDESIANQGLEDHKDAIKTIYEIAGIRQQDTIQEAVELPKVVEEEKKTSSSFFDSLETRSESKSTVQESSPSSYTTAFAPVASSSLAFDAVEKPLDSPTIQSRVNTMVASEPATVIITPEVVRIEDYDRDRKTLNELHTDKYNQNSILETQTRKKIDNIKNSISLNQKYLFINNLFDGEADLYDKVVSELELQSSFSSAKENVLRTYIERYRWNLASPEVEEFFDILKRRFIP
ncbi:MAG: hypothetical protein ACRCVT_04830 [Leadbetterella sp.]